MISLSIVRVLDSLERASMTQSKKGETSEWVGWGVLVDRLIVEYTDLSADSVRVLASRYLKKAVTDGYAEKKKSGRNTYYRMTQKGGLYLLGRRDQLDRVSPWSEEKVERGYMSYVEAPTGAPIIVEGHREEDIDWVEEVDAFMRKVKEKNPELRSMYLRFE